MTAAAAVPTRHQERTRPVATSPRPAPAALTPGVSVSAGASLLAEAFAGAETGAAEGRSDGDLLTLPRAPLAISGSGTGAPPRARAGGTVHWVSGPAAHIREPLLDLQRLAGNAAVVSALGRDGDRPVTPIGEPGTPEPEAPSDGEITLQRLDIPGLGNVDVGSYIRRALSILGPAEKSRDQAKTDARKQADDAVVDSDAKTEQGHRELEAGKADAERAGEAGFSETKAASEAGNASEEKRTEGAKAHGDHVAEKIKGLAPGVGEMVDPLAHEAGEPAATGGHQAMSETYDHAAAGGGVPAESPAPAAEPAVSHGPGPPAPGPGPPAPAAPTHGAGEPAPEVEHAPAQAGQGADHAAPSPPTHTAGEPAPAMGHAPAPGGPAPELPELPGTLPGAGAPGAAGPGKGPEGAGATGPGGSLPGNGAKPGAAPKSCELVEAIKHVKGWPAKIRSFAGGIVADIGRIPILGPMVLDLAKQAKDLATGVRKTVGAIRDVAVGAAGWVGKQVDKAVKRVQSLAKKGFELAAKGIKNSIKIQKDLVVAGWKVAGTLASQAIQGAKTRAAAKVRAAIGRVQGWLRQNEGTLNLLGHVPGLGGAVARLRQFAYARDPLGDAAAYLEQRRNAVREKLRKAKDIAIKVAQTVADAAVKTAAVKFQEAKKTASVVLAAAKKVAPYVIGVVAPGAVAVAGAAKLAANRWGSQLRAGAERVKKAIKGEACELIGDAVGPCIDMYLPKPDNNVKGFAKLTGQADVTVPLQELDVPCNVKMGRGASISVERSSTGYSVAVDGEAIVYANLAFGKKEEKAEIKVEAPTGGMATVWEHLGGAGKPAPPAGTGGTAPAAPTTGGGAPAATPATPAPAAPTPAAPAPAGGAPAPTAGGTPAPAPGKGTPGQGQGAPGKGGGSDVGTAAEVEGGLKASANLKFSFPTNGKTTCEGAGGVASLLGALGVAAALPSPLDTIARAGVAGAWEGNLVSNTVTVGVAGSAQVELSKEGIGALKGQEQAEVYVTTGVERPNQWGAATPPPPAHVPSDADRDDHAAAGPYAKPAGPTDPNALRPVLKIGAAVKGEGAAELAVPKVLAGKANVSGSGKLESLLLYDRPTDRIILQAVTAQAELGLGVSGINPALVASRLGPPFGTAAAAKIVSLGLAHSNGSIKVGVTGTANNLQKYIDTVSGYLGGNVSSISAAGLAARVRGAYDPSDFSSSVSVSATLSDKVGIEGKVEEIGDEGMKAGASAKASLEVGKEYQLYP